MYVCMARSTGAMGGEPHDVINSYRKYGVIPQSAYTGLINGATYNNFDEMQKDLKPYLEELVKMKKLPSDWKEVFEKKNGYLLRCRAQDLYV